MESSTLYYREGSSDKVYQASIRPQGEGFMVHFAYGRRGSTLSTGTKTPSPVSHNEAKRIYDKLIQEKTAKGYLPGDDAGQIKASPLRSLWFKHHSEATVSKAEIRGVVKTI